MKNNKKQWKLEFITGPMFAGKTTRLIQKIKYYQNNLHQQFLIFKPLLDNRYKNFENTIMSHDFISLKALSFQKSSEIITFLQKNNTKVKSVFFSEVHFFDQGFNDLLLFLKKANINVVLSGLTKDYQQKNFKIIDQILQFDPKIYFLYANCHYCFSKAAFSKRITDQKEVICVGGKNMYIALCDKCFRK